jgi:membrane fusion protein, multidrug efflux system
MNIFHRHFFTATLFTASVIFVCSCGEKTPPKLPPPQIQVINVIQKDVPIYEEFVGQVYGMLDIPIRARVEGFLEGIYFNEGLGVNKGQKLYTIDSQPFLAEVAAQESMVAEAQTYLVNAENELARYIPLAKINAVSKSDLDAAKATRDAAEASLKAAEANLKIANINLGYCTLKSPIDGIIGKTEARVGEFVGKEPNPVILNVVSQIKSMRVQFFITESEYLSLIREYNLKNDNTEIEDSGKGKQRNNLQLILADGSVYSEKGSIDFINRNVDTSTGSILVQATFPNPNLILRPGMFSKVKVLLETVDNAILVPQRCILELQGQYMVYIVDENNTIREKQVKAAQRVGDLWLIEAGLAPGDKVVFEGLQKVSSGAVVSPQLVEFESRSAQ